MKRDLVLEFYSRVTLSRRLAATCLPQTSQVREEFSWELDRIGQSKADATVGALGSVGVFINNGPRAGFGVNPSACRSAPYHHPFGFRPFPLFLDDDSDERHESGCYYANPYW